MDEGAAGRQCTKGAGLAHSGAHARQCLLSSRAQKMQPCVKGHKRGPCFCTGFCESLSAKQVEVRGGRGGQTAVTARALNFSSLSGGEGRLLRTTGGGE